MAGLDELKLLLCYIIMIAHQWHYSRHSSGELHGTAHLALS